MNQEYFSTSSVSRIDELHELKLEHRKVFDQYASNSTCAVNSWWSQFPLFYAQTFRKRRKSYWLILDDLFVPFVWKNGQLFMLVLPFGNGTPDTYVQVLRKSAQFCNQFSHNPSDHVLVRWLNADQLAFLRKSQYFNSLFSWKEYKKAGPEYHYRIENFIKLSGKEYSYVRRKINKFKNAHEHIVVRKYEAGDRDEILDLYRVWSLSADQRYKNLYDKNYYSAVIGHHNELQHTILVAAEKNKIVGMISGEVTDNRIAFCLFRKVADGFEGLSEYLITQLAAKLHSIDPEVGILNDGSAGESQGLQFFKERFRPIQKVTRYRLRTRGLRIIHSVAFDRPSIVGTAPSARIIFEGSSNMASKLRKGDIVSLTKALKHALDDNPAIDQCEFEQIPAAIIAQMMILLQQAYGYEVKQHGWRTVAENQYEIFFDILESSMLPKLLECIQIFYRLLYFGHDAKELRGFYDQNQSEFALMLIHYRANQMKPIILRLGSSDFDDATCAEGGTVELETHPSNSLVRSKKIDSIPKIVISGYKQKNSVAERCFHVLRELGFSASLQVGDKITTAHNQTTLADTFIARTRTLLCNPDLQAAVMVWRLGDLISLGSPCDSVTCTVITDESIEAKLLVRNYDKGVQYRVHRLLANITSRAIVINAEDDRLHAVLRQILPAGNLVLVAFNNRASKSANVLGHIRDNGKALSVLDNSNSKGKTLIWYDGEGSQVISESFRASRSLLFSLAAAIVVTENVQKIKQLTARSKSHRSSKKAKKSAGLLDVPG